jgi:hypothetical protein
VCKGEVTSPVEGQAIPRCARWKEKYRQTERQAVFLFTPSAALFLFEKTKRKRGAEEEVATPSLVTFPQGKVT